MTKKDYVLIARVLKAQTEVLQGSQFDSHHNTIFMLAEALAKENPKFDKNKFLSACGLNYQKQFRANATINSCRAIERFESLYQILKRGNKNMKKLYRLNLKNQYTGIRLWQELIVISIVWTIIFLMLFYGITNRIGQEVKKI